MKIDVQSICASYGSDPVLNGVDFSVEPGTVVTLLGANGCGKSTLLKVVGRLLAPSGGAVLLDGKSVRDYSAPELARQMAVLPQIHDAEQELTVRELAAYGRFPHRASFRMTLSGHDQEIVERSIRLMRLEKLRDRELSTLSGGERQRAWIAMTLAQEPRVLLLDEPTTFLDICCQFEILETVRMLNRKLGLTVVMVLHDLNSAARCSDRLIMLKDRAVCYSGTPREVMTPAILRDVFEIEAEILPGKDGVPYCVPTGSARNGVLL